MTQTNQQPQETGNFECTGLEIAIIGMSGRFPGASNLDEFWENLKNGVEVNWFCTDQELEDAGADPDMLKDPRYVKSKGALLEDIEYFDAAFFGYVPGEAEIMNPQIRFFHESTWEALEHAGYDPMTYEGSIGLYAGAGSSFRWEAKSTLSGKISGAGFFGATNLIDKDFLSTRICYKLNLKGPGIILNTACSTSLVAIDMACRSILTGLCNMAVAGGVSITGLERSGYLYEEGLISSNDGRCRAFDARAKGVFGGEGIGIVLLKLLDEAMEDGDTIHAVIKGTAVNNDGSRKVGYSAPSIEGQSTVIREAHQMAEIDPETIGYVETHGTGTALGDPVEIEALKQGFNTGKRHYCALGALKTNVGHLDTAAGISGLLKTVLALKHHLIPPTLHFESPNPSIDFENSPFFVNNRLREWNNTGAPLRAGVSSFGIGGTNAHIVLEEAPEPANEPRPSREYQLLVLSAKTSAALEKKTEHLAAFLKDNPDTNLADAVYTLQLGRSAMNFRRMLVCKDIDEAVALLQSPDKSPVRTQRCDIEKPQVVFMFSGLGSQYENMALELYRQEEVFRQQVDRCFGILDSLADFDIRGHLYPSLFPPPGSSPATAFEIAQLEIFTVQYALAKLLMHWGIEPDAMIGYSFGEYSAACIAGVFSLEDLLALIVKRGKLMRSIPAGAMMSVPLPAAELNPLLPDTLSLAIDNGPSCIVSGPEDAIADFESQMKGKRLMCMRLTASHAIHSSMMAEIAAQFEEAVGAVSLNPPRIPYISNVSADWIRYGDAVKPGYWSKHLQETVNFADGFRKLTAQPASIFLEIGPGQDLTALASRYIEESGQKDHQVVNLLRPGARKLSDLYLLFNRLGQVWLYGKRPDWKSFYHGEVRRRIPLPLYPFQRQRYWIEDTAVTEFRTMARQEHENTAILRKTGPRMSDWFYLPHWTRTVRFPQKDERKPEGLKWLVFSDPMGIGRRLASQLTERGHEVYSVDMGDRFAVRGPGSFTLRPGEAEDYEKLFGYLKAEENNIKRILHLWSLSDWALDHENGSDQSPIGEEYPIKSAESALKKGFYSLLYLVQAMSGMPGGQCQLTVISNHLLEVSGNELIDPGKAPLCGLIKVIPQEYPYIRCRLADITAPRPGRLLQNTVLDQLLDEITGSAIAEPEMAFRGSYRWKRSYETLDLEEPSDESMPLVKEGVYLISGGLGKIAMTLAEYFAAAFNARLVLLDRVEDSDKKTRRLEELGGQVKVAVADITDDSALETLVAEVEAQWGRIHGVIHAAGKTEGASFASLKETNEQKCLEQFQAKLYGTLALERVFGNRDLDFCLLLSSVSTVLGGLRFGPYASANAFMDGFAAWKKHHASCRWFSVNWDGMTPEDTVKGFKRVLALIQTGAGRVVVSREGDLEDRLAKWVKLETLEADEETVSRAAAAEYPRPQLLSPYIPPTTPVQKRIADVWKGIFGFKEIGVQDDFLELGGDSLKAITAISLINKSLNVEVPLAEFFKSPTIETLTQFIEGAETTEHISIEPAEEREYYVLSSAQNRLYLLQQLDKQSTAYNETNLLQLQGQLDLDRLRDSFLEMIRRHESLRTSIRIIDKEARQIVHNPGDVEFVFDYVDMSPAEAEVDVSAEIHRFIRPFDLGVAPFFRVGVIKQSQDEFVMIIDIHHIVTDGVTFDLFVHELQSFYWGLSLPMPRLQYKDYCQWQQSPAQLAARARQETYWLKRFTSAGDIPVLDLPADYPRPAILTFSGHRFSFSLPQQLSRQLRELAADQSVTLYMVLLTIYYTLLFKLSGQQDIIIGTPVVGRRHADLESIIGMFINTLPLRNFPSNEKTLLQFLNEVKTNTLEDFENQDYAFEDMVDRLAVKRDTSHNPLFDVMFVLQVGKDRLVKPGTGNGAGLNILPYSYESSTAKFDITLEAHEGGDSLAFNMEYRTDLFGLDTMERFAGYLEKIADAFVSDPRREISRLDILSPEEKHRLLKEFNSPAVEYTTGITIHERFEEYAARTPDITAAQLGDGGNPAGDKSLSYSRLSEASQALARQLRHRGVGPGDIVGLLSGRGVDMIVGMLGILKSGAAYLPIDPAYPKERVSYMVRDSAARLTLCTKEVAEALRETNMPLDKLLILEGNPEIGQVDASEPPSVSSSEPAYVIYTSGSTGRPKGTLVNHNGVINMVECHYRLFGQGTGRRSTQVASPGFDAMAAEVWNALLNGASVYVIPDSVRIDVNLLVQWLVDHRITASFQSTALARQLIAATWPRQDLALQMIWTAGDRLSDYPPKDLPFKLYNLYGLTEATVWSTWYDVVPQHEQIYGNGAPPIGKPIDNHQLYVLDANLKLQPPGIPGELCVGGEGLAQGYLNRPELTAERFVYYKLQNITNQDNPGSGSPISSTAESPLEKGEPRNGNHTPVCVIYRTGDLARWLPDGNLEFLGRIDNQVKIRGFRIELREIETCLTTYQGVKEAVVLDRQDANGGGKFLCAYIVPDDSGRESMTLAPIKSHLAIHLPEYMLPSKVVLLERMPLTPNGKIDRKALLAMDTYLGTGADYVPPGSETEETIAAIWKEVLNLDKIGIHDNFFDVGGNSIVLVQVSSKLKEAFQREVPVVRLFQYTTISALAEFIQAGRAAPEGDIFDKEKDKEKTAAIDKGKDRMKRFVRKSKGGGNE